MFMLELPRLLRPVLALSLAVCSLVFSSAAAQPSEPGLSKPNIIIVLLDDLGYSDIGAYGGEISRPL